EQVIAVERFEIGRTAFNTQRQLVQIRVAAQPGFFPRAHDEANVQLLTADAGQEMDVLAALLSEQHAWHQVDSPGAQVLKTAQEGRFTPLQIHPDTVCGRFQYADQRAAGQPVDSSHFRRSFAKVDAQHLWRANTG